ncbi:F-box/WD repeat-containing protein 7 [Amphibalanus amphitrite]|uniref:F-box/WD repeat-containing protein 7 n=1 Tax=Amphibalanus amphitrite TaxID=1232801 RepID=A0A6A4X571_AMPAM|nr:F-box/WD repeat-containing protein 7 [Amphibalanus amphitrite]
MFLGNFCQANPKILLHSDPPSCLHMNNLTVLYTGHCDKPRATCHVQGDAVAVYCNVEKQNYASTFTTTVVRTCENNKYLALFIWILRGQSQNFWSGRRMLVAMHAHGVVVSGHGDGSINVWDVATRRLRHELRAHAGWVTDLAVSDQGVLISGCKDGTAILWRLTSGAVLHKLSGVHGHRQRVTAVRLLRGLAVTGSRDGWVKLWNMGTGALVRNLVTPEVSGGPVKHVWVGPDRLVCGVQNNASDRPQVLVMEMAMRTADGALVSGIEDIVVGATGGNGGKNE